MKRYLRKILAGLTFAVMMGAGASGAEPAFIFNVSDDGPALSVTFDGDTFYVRSKDEVISEIQSEICEEAVKDDPSLCVSSVDANFDGFNDLMITETLYVPNPYCSFYLWNPETGKLERDESLEEIIGPRFDSEAKRIIGFSHGSATDNQETEYRWIDGRPTLTWRKTQVYDGDSDLFVITEEVRDEEGAMEVSSEISLTGGQMERFLEGEPFFDRETIDKISEAARELLGSQISGDGEFHGRSITDDKSVSAWLFELDSGEIACFEVADDLSGLYLNKGGDDGVFRIDFGDGVSLGQRVY